MSIPKTSSAPIASLTASSCALAILLLAYFPVAPQAAWVWLNSETYVQGLLVAPIALGMILAVSRRFHLLICPPFFLSALIFACASIWFMAYFSSTQVLVLLAFAGLVYLLLMALFGLHSGLAFFLPVSVLVCTVPIWEAFTPTLQKVTVLVNTSWLNLAQRTAYIDGDTVHVAAGKFIIEGGCSGLHFFLVGITLAVIYSGIFLRSVLGRTAFILSVLVIVLFDNWLRVFIIILAGDLTNMQHYLVTVDHYKFGWVIFAVSLLPIVAIGRWVEHREHRGGLFGTADRWLEKTEKRLATKFSLQSHKRARVGVFLLATFFFPAYAMTLVLDTREAKVLGPLSEISNSDWGAREPSPEQKSKGPRFMGAEAELLKIYETDEREILLYVNYYSRQTEGAEVVAWENELFPGARSASRVGSYVYENDETVRFGTYQVDYGSEKRIALVGYYTGKRVLEEGVSHKIWTGVNAFGGVLNAGAIVISASCNEECDRAKITTTTFFAENAEQIIDAVNK